MFFEFYLMFWKSVNLFRYDVYTLILNEKCLLKTFDSQNVLSEKINNNNNNKMQFFP